MLGHPVRDLGAAVRAAEAYAAHRARPVNARRLSFADQLDAAVGEARGTVRDAAQSLGLEQVEGVPGPFAAAMLAELTRLAALGRLRSCEHLRSPGPAFTFAWARGRLFCPRCVMAPIVAVRGTDEDGTCDVCRRHAGTLVTTLGSAGPVIVAFGACEPCHAVETGRAAA